MNVDVIDRCILALLQLDGRLSHTDITRRLGIPEATVRRRIKRLLDEGIAQIAALPEPNKIGYGVHGIIGLKVHPGKIASVFNVLTPLPQVRYAAVTAGTYDLVIETFFQNNAGLREFLLETLGQIPGLAGTETSYVLDIVKRAYKIDLLGALNGTHVTPDDTEVVERCHAAIRELEDRTGRGGEAEPG